MTAGSGQDDHRSADPDLSLEAGLEQRQKLLMTGVEASASHGTHVLRCKLEWDAARKLYGGLR